MKQILLSKNVSFLLVLNLTHILLIGPIVQIDNENQESASNIEFNQYLGNLKNQMPTNTDFS